MLTRRRFLTLSGVTGIAAAGMVMSYQLLPSGGEKPGDGPPSIAYGSDTCAHCKMIISDARFAAAWRAPNGKTTRFDDIGCMTAMAAEGAPPAGTAFWVHSYLDESPLLADDATFVVTGTIATPMAYGIVAVATHSQASQLVTEAGGETTTWASLRADG
ncbi:MAG TPA: nitrous oxide reductase accessory protein NosL, partial [Tepidiformaceae bacterium]|nr:nitrous oxide reductase accessory protein NosL [Tepidiformaceae bacterium]